MTVVGSHKLRQLAGAVALTATSLACDRHPDAELNLSDQSLYGIALADTGYSDVLLLPTKARIQIPERVPGESPGVYFPQGFESAVEAIARFQNGQRSEKDKKGLFSRLGECFSSELSLKGEYTEKQLDEFLEVTLPNLLAPHGTVVLALGNPGVCRKYFFHAAIEVLETGSGASIVTLGLPFEVDGLNSPFRYGQVIVTPSKEGGSILL